MDMGGMTPQEHACKISMLWNWYTVDACFLSEQWHVRSAGTFAVTVIGVFLITALVEGVRRAGREYDRRLVATARARGAAADKAALTAGSLDSKDINIATIRVRPTAMQQLVRAGFFGVQFTVAYLLMLLAMYYNGFVIMAIILGGIAGYTVFSTDTLGEIEHEGGAACC